MTPSLLRTRKETLYNAYKGRTETKFCELNVHGLCQGKRQQVRDQLFGVYICCNEVSSSLLLLQTSQEEMKLFCWYEYEIHTYFKVGPLQVELLSMHPKAEVVMIHDVVGQGRLAFLRNDTGRAYVVCESGATDPKECLYSYSWVYGNTSEKALRTLQLMSRISGLKTTSHPLAILAQAPGGYHRVHTDSVRWPFHLKCKARQRLQDPTTFFYI